MLKDISQKVTQVQYECVRKISAAAHILREDVEEGFKHTAVEVAAHANESTEVADRITEETVSFILSLADKVRHFIIAKVCEISPEMEKPDMDKIAARTTYDSIIKGLPNNLFAVMKDIEESEEKKSGPEVRVVITGPEGLDGILRSILGGFTAGEQKGKSH